MTSRIFLIMLLLASNMLHGQQRTKNVNTPATLPTLFAIQPDVLVAGRAEATITLKGRGVYRLQQIDIHDCDGNVTHAGVSQSRLILHGSVLSKPCVLRIGTVESGFRPLAVTDPLLAKWPLPLI